MANVRTNIVNNLQPSLRMNFKQRVNDCDIAWTTGRVVPGKTLVVCPSSLLGQWDGEVSNRVRRNKINVLVHHGGDRETKARRLAKHDIVITTYNILQYDDKKSESPLYNIRWKRIILDEAHVIRNHKTKTAEAVFKLKGKRRFALTGTPIHNKSTDFYSLVKFIKCSPFDDLAVWKKWVDNRDAAGTDRLNTITQALMLRRTKKGLQEKGELSSLKERNFKIIRVTLDSHERDAYEKLLSFSQSLFSDFLAQQALKKNALEYVPMKSRPKQYKGVAVTDKGDNPFESDPQLMKLHDTMKKIENVQSYHILVMLLRLRQFCCQPSLVNSMLNAEDKTHEGIEDSEGLDIDLLDKMGRMSIGVPQPEAEVAPDTNLLSVNNPVFSEKWISSKLKEILNVLEDILKTDDKAIIVSQWVSVLNVIQGKLKERGVKLVTLDGKVCVADRPEIVNRFNGKGGPRVMLLSLTAGGVGLNLIGANHLLLVDLHWNPQLETQACDRIYRVGQPKDVHIYKFIATDTIDERVHSLQAAKLEIADEVLTGKPSSKLSLDDLKLLFGMQ